MLITRAAGLALGMLVDAVVGDPHRGHPVAAFGTFAAAVEQRLYRDDRLTGAGFTAATVLPVALGGLVLERTTRRRPVAHVLATALATWAVVGARTLAHEGRTMAGFLADDDLPAARERLSHLCGRDPREMPAEDLARATVESVAENTNDAVVTPLLWGAAFGIPGLLAHRAVNTLDAMVGHRNERYGRFGTASAVLDDVMAWPGARLTGALASALAGVAGGSPARAWATMRRDAHDHPSPNGGWCEAAWAGALGVQLGGANVYFGRVEQRGLLGSGPRPSAGKVRDAARLGTAVAWATTGLVAAALTIRAASSRRTLLAQPTSRWLSERGTSGTKPLTKKECA